MAGAGRGFSDIGKWINVEIRPVPIPTHQTVV